QQCELLGQQVEADGFVAYLMAQELDAMVHDFRMVIDQCRQIINTEPAGERGALAFDKRIIFRTDQGVVCNSHYAVIGKAVHATEGFQLLKVKLFYPGQFFQQAGCSIPQVFVIADPATGQCPFVFMGRVVVFDQQDLELIMVQAKDQVIDRKSLNDILGRVQRFDVTVFGGRWNVAGGHDDKSSLIVWRRRAPYVSPISALVLQPVPIRTTRYVNLAALYKAVLEWSSANIGEYRYLVRRRGTKKTVLY